MSLAAYFTSQQHRLLAGPAYLSVESATLSARDDDRVQTLFGELDPQDAAAVSSQALGRAGPAAVLAQSCSLPSPGARGDHPAG